MDCAKITNQSHEFYLECAFFTNQRCEFYLDQLFYSALKSSSSTLGIGAFSGPVSHLAGEYGTLIFPVPCQVFFYGSLRTTKGRALPGLKPRPSSGSHIPLPGGTWSRKCTYPKSATQVTADTNNNDTNNIDLVLKDNIVMLYQNINILAC